jgi:hypothetical protein
MKSSPRMANINSESVLLKSFPIGHYQISATGVIHGEAVHGSESVEMKPGALRKIALVLK